MWPFNKKSRDKEEENLNLSQDERDFQDFCADIEESLEMMDKESKGKSVKRTLSCPPILLTSRLCACIDCPKNGNGCRFEEVCKATGCLHFIRTCSVKSRLITPDKHSGIEGTLPGIVYK